MSSKPIIFAVGIVLALWGSYHLRPGAFDETNAGLMLVALAVAVLAFAARGAAFPAVGRLQVVAIPPLSTRLRHPWTVAGGMLWLILVFVNVTQYPLPTLHQLVIFGVMAFALGMGFGGLPVRIRWRRALLLELALLAGVCLVAWWARTHILETSIDRYIDEIATLEALNKLENEPMTALLTPYAGVQQFTWTFLVLQLLPLSIFGKTYTGLRIISGVFGVLNIIAVWWLGRTLFGRKVGLIAALLLATFPPHVHFSRIGLNNIADPVMMTFALGFLLRGLYSTHPQGRAAWVAWGGVCFGMTAYFYEGGRLLYTPLMIAFLTAWMFLRHRAAQPIPWPSLRLFAVAGALVIAPYYLTIMLGDFQATPRLQSTMKTPAHWEANGIDTPGEFALDIITGFRYPPLALLQLPDDSDFYGGERSLLLTELIPVFLVGLALCVGRWRRVGALLLLLWIIGQWTGLSFLVKSLHAPRYVAGFPAFALILALGLWRLRRPGLMLVAACLIAGWQLHYYFNTHIDAYNNGNLNEIALDNMAQQVAEVPQDAVVYLITPLRSLSLDANVLLEYYDRFDVDLVHVITGDFSPVYLARLRFDRPAVFVTSWQEDAIIQLLMRVIGAPTLDPDLPPAQYYFFYTE